MISISPSLFYMFGIKEWGNCDRVYKLFHALSFQIEGKRYTLEPKDYIFKEKFDEADYCYPLINYPQSANYMFNSNDNTEIVLGVPFIKKYWVHFDIDSSRIGLYDSKSFVIIISSAL